MQQFMFGTVDDKLQPKQKGTDVPVTNLKRTKLRLLHKVDTPCNRDPNQRQKSVNAIIKYVFSHSIVLNLIVS